MKITVLVENATSSDRFIAKHGLSLFLEVQTAKNRDDSQQATRILFDMGPDKSFLLNASKLGVDIESTDFAVISHAHYDHGGGLKAYLHATEKVENPARIYVNEHIFGEHAAGNAEDHFSIGIDPSLEANDRFIKVGKEFDIKPGFKLFSGVDKKHPIAKSNARLLEELNGRYVSDSFSHEQSLLITELTTQADKPRYILVSGCSHSGILNIIEKAESLVGSSLDAVVAGFHLMDPDTGLVEDLGITRELAQELKARPTQYYTFHCTGLDAYSVLRDELGEQIQYLYVGSKREV